MVTTLPDYVNVPTSDAENEKPVWCSAQSVFLTLALVRINLPPLFFSFLALNAALRRNTRTAAGLNTVVVFFFFFLTSDNTLEAVVTAPRFIAVQLQATQLFFKAWPASPNTSASVWIQYSRSHGSYTRPCCVCHCFARRLFCCSILHLWHTEYIKNNHSVCKT